MQCDHACAAPSNFARRREIERWQLWERALKKFVLIAGPRTGSTLVIQVANASPEVTAFYELMHPKQLLIHGAERNDLIPERDGAPMKFLNNLFAAEDSSCVGFKLFDGHNDAVLKNAIQSPHWHKMVLFRENFLAVYSSNLISMKKNVWSSSSQAAAKLGQVDTNQNTWTETVTFDAEDFDARHRRYLAWYRRATDMLNEHNMPYLFLRYSELLSEPLVRRVFSFLGVSQPAEIQISIQKNNTSIIVDRFENQEEVMRHLEKIGKIDWAYESFEKLA